VGSQQFRHWFDGLAMLHRFRIAAGSVEYANRFVRSRGYDAALASGRIAFKDFATDPALPFLARLAAKFRAPAFSHNTVVSVAQIAGTHVAMTETPEVIEFNPDSLENGAVLDQRGGAPGAYTTAHILRDDGRKAFFSFTIDFGLTSTYHVCSIPDGSARRVPFASLPVKAPAYMHSLGMSGNYVVMVEPPFRVNPLAIKFSGKPLIENFSWRPGLGTVFTAIHKDTGVIAGRWTTDPFFLFHHVNAFNDRGALMVDMATYPDQGVIGSLYLDRLRGPNGGTLPRPTFERFRLEPGGRVTRTTLSTAVIELPRVNESLCLGRPYQYAYGISVRDDHATDFFNQLVKIDVHSGIARTWAQDNQYPGEPVYVPNPRGTREDDGVILSVVLDGARGTAYLLVLDASTFVEVARADVPQHIPFGFHGQFFVAKA